MSDDWTLSETRLRMFTDAVEQDRERRARLYRRIEALRAEVAEVDERLERANTLIAEIKAARAEQGDR